MTHSIDRFLISHGFEAQDVTSLEYRPFLYSGIIITALMTLMFSSLAVQAWF